MRKPGLWLVQATRPPGWVRSSPQRGYRDLPGEAGLDLRECHLSLWSSFTEVRVVMTFLRPEDFCFRKSKHHKAGRHQPRHPAQNLPLREPPAPTHDLTSHPPKAAQDSRGEDILSQPHLTPPSTRSFWTALPWQLRLSSSRM